MYRGVRARKSLTARREWIAGPTCILPNPRSEFAVLRSFYHHKMSWIMHDWPGFLLQSWRTLPHISKGISLTPFLVDPCMLTLPCQNLGSKEIHTIIFLAILHLHVSWLQDLEQLSYISELFIFHRVQLVSQSSVCNNLASWNCVLINAIAILGDILHSPFHTDGFLLISFGIKHHYFLSSTAFLCL